MVPAEHVQHERGCWWSFMKRTFTGRCICPGLLLFTLMSCSAADIGGIGQVRGESQRMLARIDKPMVESGSPHDVKETAEPSPFEAEQLPGGGAGPDVWSEGGWIVAKAECSDENIGKEAAMERARDDARLKAISHGIGVHLTSSTLQEDLFEPDRRFSSFLRYTSTAAGGRITVEQEKWDEEDIGRDENNLTIRNYILTLRCKVEHDNDVPDPAFFVSFFLNKDSYREGEAIELTVTATRDCYLTVLNLDHAAGRIAILFPNELDPDNLYRADEAMRIPRPGSGFSFRAMLPDGKTVSTELIWVLATRERIDVPGVLAEASRFPYYSTPFATVQDFHRTLVSVPLDSRAEGSCIIRITQ